MEVIGNPFAGAQFSWLERLPVTQEVAQLADIWHNRTGIRAHQADFHSFYSQKGLSPVNSLQLEGP